MFDIKPHTLCLQDWPADLENTTQRFQDEDLLCSLDAHVRPATDSGGKTSIACPTDKTSIACPTDSGGKTSIACPTDSGGKNGPHLTIPLRDMLIF